MSAERWKRVARAAERQHGMLATPHLRGVGFSVQEIRTLVARGQLDRTERGIYRLAGHSPTWQSTVLAHCWATRGRAFGATAAAVHGLGDAHDVFPGYAELLVPLGVRPRARPRLRIHRSSHWDRVRTLEVERIPVIPLPQTLVSLAMHHRFELFRSAFNQGRRQNRITLNQLSDAAQPFLIDGVSRSSYLRDALAHLTAAPTLSLSDWSDRFADWCEQQRLPRPQLEYRIIGATGCLVAQVDLCWPEHRMVIELDSWAWHHDRDAFESDRTRYTRLAAHGWTVLTITWRRWKDEPDAVANDIRTAIAARRP
ncbi:MAG: DUF559 domain-containing protein [Acidimicrobiia bacterium]|nr:DUF559 domain-containing protein [Acidimicrobiia bacterium]